MNIYIQRHGKTYLYVYTDKRYHVFSQLHILTNSRFTAWISLNFVFVIVDDESDLGLLCEWQKDLCHLQPLNVDFFSSFESRNN